ncbi:conserved membrane hypothetical protein [Candidatus Defluviicoccus seviourii]|uniref:Death domain-containing protein n=1 Tax=Candidatus Defluviicoccus seviourii TaxID=2565273 RepID=A0A564WH15_9PROT|nr:conserved membrane hypothetical protein [Candidatus Defluviicoccus seviourii]
MPDVDPPPAVVIAPRQDLARLVLAEAVRLHEENRGFLIEDRAAEAAAVAAGGDLQRRIITRAGALTVAADVRDALDRLRQLFAFSSIAGFLIALALGAGSALALMASAPSGYGAAVPTNFFLLYGSLLGPHALMLAAWLFALLVLPNRGSGSSLGGGSLGGSLGGGILALVRRLSRWTLKEPLEAAAARAFALVMTGSPAGRWLVSALTHGLWFGYLAGGSAMVFLLLSTRQVSFAWETTILSAEDYIALTRALAAAPGWLGFAAPDAQQIAASQIPLAAAPSAAADRAWAGLLLGSLVVYGVLPRLVLVLLCLGLGRRAICRYRLDTSRPGFARLQERLVPLAQTTGIIDADQDWPAAAAAPSSLGQVAEADTANGIPGPAQVVGDGPVAILAFESERPKGGWPLLPDGVSWLDCGSIEDRADRARVCARLGAAVRPPRLLVLACSLLTAPDRGVGAFLAEFAGEAGLPLALLLSQDQHYRARVPGDQAAKASAVGQRIADWRQIAGAAGVPAANIAAIDLDQPGAATRQRLQAWLGRSGEATR